MGVGLIFGMAYWGFVGAFIVVTVLLIRWQLKFGDLLTNDPDFEKARRSKNVALFLLIVAFPLGVILNPFWG